MMFSGIGVGALLSATLVPSLAQHSLSAVWLGLGAICVLALWLGWRSARALPAPAPITVVPGATPSPAPVATLWTLPVVLVFLAYTTDAFGFVPHTVFWVDYLARELQLGTAYGATQWAFLASVPWPGRCAWAFAPHAGAGGAPPPVLMCSRCWLLACRCCGSALQAMRFLALSWERSRLVWRPLPRAI